MKLVSEHINQILGKGEYYIPFFWSIDHQHALQVTEDMNEMATSHGSHVTIDVNMSKRRYRRRISVRRQMRRGL